MVRICPKKYPTESVYNKHFTHYPFELDHFQKYTIEGIEKKINILKTAHTGSGKTLGAEYIIKTICPTGKKVIYTSPIKSLSNQKFHEFSKKFPDISFGVLTGDIKFNPDADCLIMTTEILRNFIFQRNMSGAGLYFEMDINDLAWVVFDEVHYINDAERGKVWEETIMSLPPHVRLLMLSATIDRAEEFAKWVECVTGNEVWIASTDTRVVPLSHYSFMTLRSKLSEAHGRDNKLIDNKLGKPVLLREQHSEFKDKNYYELAKINEYFRKNRLHVNRNFTINTVVRYLNEHDLLPAICFVFSRKKTAEYAKFLSISLNDGKTMNIIPKECDNILISKLTNYKEYQNLPEYHELVHLMKKGIAVHHSGILPVFKEMIEIMFSRGYIKILFATETFAVGINMPAKSVIFSSLQKFDGRGFRYLYPHEYTQMAGRAGRRGMDKRGHVFHLNNMFELPSLPEYKQILCGKPQSITSKFQIHYNLIIRLISIGKLDIKSFVEKSMLQNYVIKEGVRLQEEIDRMQENYEKKTAFVKEFCDTPFQDLKDYHELEQKVSISNRKVQKGLRKKMRKCHMNFKTFEKDYVRYKEIVKLDLEITKAEKTLKNAGNFIPTNIKLILDILKYYYFVNVDDTLTPLGEAAALIQEVHSLVFAEKLCNKEFDDLSPVDLISIFSCFCNCSIPEHSRRAKPVNVSQVICNRIEEIYDRYNDFYKIEMDYRLDAGNHYEMHYELCDAVVEWCNAGSENECKMVYQKLKSRGIFMGEFIKAILKINNIAKEFEKVCEKLQNMKLLGKMKDIGPLTLKSVVTNQSLYL